MSKEKDNLEIFDGKTFQDLTKDIYENTLNKKKQLDILVKELHSHMNSVHDVVQIGPILKELMDVSVKNDEHLVKLASVLQRIITKPKGSDNQDNFSLSENEKAELLGALKETADSVQKESDKISNINSDLVAN